MYFDLDYFVLFPQARLDTFFCLLKVIKKMSIHMLNLCLTPMIKSIQKKMICIYFSKIKRIILN